MKAIKYIFLILFLGSMLQSCSDDFLEETNPNDISTETFWQTETHAKAGITSLYGTLSMNYNYGVFEFIFMPENWRSDEFIHNDAGYPTWGTLSTFTNTANVYEIGRYYWRCYSLVSKANQCITNIPSCVMNQTTEEDDAKLINQYVAEAKFFRAFAYFRLLKNFRNPPFVTKEISGLDDLYPSQVDRSEIWALVVEDLKFAMNNLPSKADRTDGRATSGAAAGYLASVYMHNQQYNVALPVLNKIIAGDFGTYDLTPSYKENFNGTNENNIESLFEIQYAISSKKRQTTHTFEATFAWWDVGISTPWMFDLLGSSLDKDGQVEQRSLNSLYEQYPAYETSIEKWTMDNSFEGKDGRYAINNLVQLRYADILLYYAEALGENNVAKIPTAYTHINKVRSRSNLSNLVSGTQAQFRNDIMKERAIEFCFESHRWYDLVRWDQADWIDLKQTLINNNKDGANNFDPAKHTYYPIPNSEYETNPNLKRDLQW